ncbi:unnamed protein product [Rotaria socialis]|uniref:Uncharacterized protein n=1 Tax=Rotaria socialis TaxID=392032 RepID=A0A818ZPS2_9BILA|nr:unnamed protein product [Rotaria socialis]
MYEFFYLSLFYQVALALVYNDPCTDKCNLPGMICMNNKCKCDSKNRRFWTGARCSFCPTDWSMAAGVYEWLDKSLPSFNDKSDLWCKKTTANLGYVYVYDEPTKLIGDGSEVESCSGFWRGRTSVYVVCLDDQLCSRPYPFICEKTEYTENIFGGAPLLLALVGGILYFLKFRNSTGAQKKRQTNGGASREESIRSDEYTNEGELNVDRHPAPAHRDLTTIDEKKPKQDKRGGYSKQQFDEFE